MQTQVSIYRFKHACTFMFARKDAYNEIIAAQWQLRNCLAITLTLHASAWASVRWGVIETYMCLMQLYVIDRDNAMAMISHLRQINLGKSAF